MSCVIGRTTGHTVSWFHKDPVKSNKYCLYCGDIVGEPGVKPSDKEHLIGRQFVPIGTLNSNSFNFLFRACQVCNGVKSNAERHVSSVTLINSPQRKQNRLIDLAAERKARGDFHPDMKGVPVGKAVKEQSIMFPLGNPITVSLGLVAPPQLNAKFKELLAFKHIQGLFSLVTAVDIRDGVRMLPYTQFVYFADYAHGDWGNPQLREIAKRVEGWRCVVNINSAEGNFRAIMKRHEEFGWHWALEWNHYCRVVGAIVLPEQGAKHFEELPDLNWSSLPDGSGRLRLETPLLGQEEDELFSGEVL